MPVFGAISNFATAFTQETPKGVKQTSESSGRTFFGGRTLGRDQDLIIDPADQNSCFCNDKSGFSVVEAFQDKRLDSSSGAPLRQETNSSSAKRNKDWILNSGLLDSQFADEN